jgi:hypothetical protein
VQQAYRFLLMRLPPEPLVEAAPPPVRSACLPALPCVTWATVHASPAALLPAGCSLCPQESTADEEAVRNRVRGMRYGQATSLQDDWAAQESKRNQVRQPWAPRRAVLRRIL